jgi:hypothetical protein
MRKNLTIGEIAAFFEVDPSQVQLKQSAFYDRIAREDVTSIEIKVQERTKSAVQGGGSVTGGNAASKGRR